jgi:phosphoesterase RecJ-like protein
MPDLDIAASARAFRERITARDRIWVTVHESPDGDSIGAALAVYGVLRRLGKQVAAIRQHPYPQQYLDLGRAPEMVDVGRLGELFEPEVIIACDVGSMTRVGAVLDHIRPETDVVNIDHHAGNDGPGRPCRLLNLVDPSYASTTMLAYVLLEAAWPGCIGPEEATCLYIGLITDTGCFRHSNTNAAALRVASELAARGADAGTLAEQYMFRRRPEALQLLGSVLSTLEFEAGGRFASLLLSQDMLRRTGARLDETEGFVNYATSLEGVHAAALLRETGPSETRVSLRASGLVDVSALAREFGGGGHPNAAGATLAMDLLAARARITEAALRHLAAADALVPAPRAAKGH